MLFAPPDFDLFHPPDYPEVLTVFVHARWRRDQVDDATARGPRWEDPADFRRWQAALPDVPANPGDGRIGDGVRTAHLLPRMGQAPRVGFASYKKIFDEMETPVRLSPTQTAAVEQFQALRSVDWAIHVHRELPREEATRVRRIVLRGLPETVAEVPSHTAAQKFHYFLREKLDYNGWTLEVRPCVPNRNPAAFLSGCYLAPTFRSPTLPSRPASAATPAAPGVGTDEARLLASMTEALQLRDSARMAEVFAGMIAHVQHGGPQIRGVPLDGADSADAAEEEDSQGLDGAAEPGAERPRRRGRAR